MRTHVINRKSIKEQELKNFILKKHLSTSQTIVTDDLDTIKEWVTRFQGKPVKLVYVNKRRITIELIELSFANRDRYLYQEVTWEHWYEIFQNQQLKFIFIPSEADGKSNLFYKLTK